MSDPKLEKMAKEWLEWHPNDYVSVSDVVALLERVREENGYAQGVRDQREFQVALIEEDRVLTREKRDSEWQQAFSDAASDLLSREQWRQLLQPEKPEAVGAALGSFATFRDSEMVKALKGEDK